MIAFDAFSSGSVLPGSSITFSHTCTGSDLILIVGIASHNLDVITGVTYNAVSMTQSVKSTFTGPTMYFYSLVNPATGANNIVISASTGAEYLRAMGVSYTGVQQSGQPDASDEQTVLPGTSVTTSLTQSVNKAWQIGLGDDAGVGTLSAGTGIGTDRGNVGGVVRIGDSNVITRAGSQSLTWDNSSSTNLWALQFSLADINQSTGARIMGMI